MGTGHGGPPAINVNVSSNSTVVGNTVKNVTRCVNIANAPATATVITGNTFENYGGTAIIFQETSATPTTDNLVARNTFDASGGNGNAVTVQNAHANILGNLFLNHSADTIIIGKSTGTRKPIYVDNNQIVGQIDGSIVKNFSSPQNKPNNYVSFSGNRIEYGESATNLNTPPVELKGDYGLVSGNIMSYRDSNTFYPTLGIEEGKHWIVRNNVIRGGGYAMAVYSQDGVISDNVVYNGGIKTNSGTPTTVRDNETRGGTKPLQLGSTNSFTIGNERGGTYSGDGTTGRFIQTAIRPEYVIVDDNSGTKYDVHAQFGTGFDYNTPTGELSITDGGFIVGDNSGDSDPNTSGNTYTFYAR